MYHRTPRWIAMDSPFWDPLGIPKGAPLGSATPADFIDRALSVRKSIGGVSARPSWGNWRVEQSVKEW